MPPPKVFKVLKDFKDPKDFKVINDFIYLIEWNLQTPISYGSSRR